MRFSIAAAAAALAATAQARISGIAVPEIIRPGDSVTLKLVSEGYIQTVDDIAVAFGYTTGEGYPGTLSNLLQSSYLGPDESNLGEKNITKVVTFPEGITKGNGIVSAALFSLYGASKGGVISNYNVTVTFGDATSATYKISGGAY